ncbi:hypothetical protein NDU88_005551 [Pleurodeles waltl]|uniref:Uncharacterized protein n=1 Tax=Pleurodeles waltl TaxID=8319 RepID=A0AAV7SM84_PLEWA|nr:hypothetical protein NDU88_005551 [Pleurodeles waltl]
MCRCLFSAGVASQDSVATGGWCSRASIARRDVDHLPANGARPFDGSDDQAPGAGKVASSCCTRVRVRAPCFGMVLCPALVARVNRPSIVPPEQNRAYTGCSVHRTAASAAPTLLNSLGLTPALVPSEGNKV